MKNHNKEVEYKNTKEFQQKIKEIFLKIFNGEQIKDILDLTDLLDYFTFNLLVAFQKEISLVQELELKSVSELTEDQKNDCAIELYLELKKENKIK